MRHQTLLLLQLVLLVTLQWIPLHAAKDSNNKKSDEIDLLSMIASYTCDYSKDTCGWQMDGQCDSTLDMYDCWEQDCWDCDPCTVFDMDCQGCVESGCQWCPGDAKCRATAMEADFWLSQTVSSSCPTMQDWQSTCTANQQNVYSDPLYDSMAWQYKMINVEAVWRQGITGKGVHVRINDVGMDANHTEFQGRFDYGHSCANFVSETQGDSLHGTAVASVLAANGNNDECAVGIAPEVTISACTFRENFIDDEVADMLASQLQMVDISSNSWGPVVCTNLNNVRIANEDGNCRFDKSHEYSPCQVCQGQDPEYLNDDCRGTIDEYCTYYYSNDPIACGEFLDIYTSCEYHSLSDSAHRAFVEGVIKGRQGKGIIYVYAAGNSNELGAVTNTDGFINTRFTIAVGAVSKNGMHASYSTMGSALHVVAPGGDFDEVANNIVAQPGGGCHEVSGGTSFSAPVVSGVIALLLQVNPKLGWRDVQTILAFTSQQIQANDDSWIINGAGLHHSDKYGFGLVDAAAAVEVAQNWTNAGPEQQLVWRSRKGNLTIADDELLPTTDTITVDAADSFVMESVVVYLDLLHSSRGDLLIALTSPAGTMSTLLPGKRPENQQLERNEPWKLLTVRNWGENPEGEWKLTLVDENKGTQGDCANVPFEHLHLDPEGYYSAYTCLDVEQRMDCWNGTIEEEQLVAEFVDRQNNLTAADACCVCGGGTPVSKVNLLKSWTLIIYGYDSLYSAEKEEESDDVDAEKTNEILEVDVVNTTAPNSAGVENVSHVTSIHSESPSNQEVEVFDTSDQVNETTTEQLPTEADAPVLDPAEADIMESSHSAPQSSKWIIYFVAIVLAGCLL